MPLTWKDRIKVSIASGGTGTLTLGSAASGYQTFAAGDDGKLFPYVIENGTAWETGYGTYTHSGTTFARTTRTDSSSGGAIDAGTGNLYVDLVAGGANRVNLGVLENVAGTDAATTMVVGNMYVVDMSAWATADRTYTLPTTAAVGSRIGIMISAGNTSTFELDITAGTSDTLNGVAGGTVWSRLFITGECVIMRCVTADSAWIVEYDGRIPCKCRLERNTNLAITASTATHLAYDSEIYDVGDIGSASTGDITARRAGKYLFNMFHGIDTQVDAGSVDCRLYTNALGAVLAFGPAPTLRLTSGNAIFRGAFTRQLTLAAGDIVEGAVVATASGNTQESSTTYNPFIEVLEILP